MADVIDLAAARAARVRSLPSHVTNAHRIGVQIGRSPFRGTAEQEEALARRLEAAVEMLKRRHLSGRG